MSKFNEDKEIEYYDELLNYSIENYKNFFETDLEEDFQEFEALPNELKYPFLETL